MSGNNINVLFGFDASNFAEGYRQQVQQAIEDEFLVALADLQRNSPVGVSEQLGKPSLANSWSLETLADSSGEIILNITNDAFPALNRLEGRQAGKQPPSEALEDWVRYKLNPDTKKVKGIAFVIARKIGKVGTDRSQRNFKQFDLSTGEPAPNSAIDRAIKRIKKKIDGIKILT